MPTLDGTDKVPMFLMKLWNLVEDKSTNHLIFWTQNGQSFIIRNQAQFSKDLLPMYYKHNNMASFIRQLNMYGFHKVISPDSGGLKMEKDEMEFSHKYFIKGKEDLLEKIKRKIPMSHLVNLEKPKNLSNLVSSVRDMRKDQDSMSDKLRTLESRNEAIWREYTKMRQQFSNQQRVIENLIQLLAQLVRPTQPFSGQLRNYSQLALGSGDDNSSGRFSQFGSIAQEFMPNADVVGGAVIQDVTDMQDFSNIFGEMSNDASSSPAEVCDVIPSEQINADSVGGPKRSPESFHDPHTLPAIASLEGSGLPSPGSFSDLLSELASGVQSAPLSPDSMTVVDPSAVTQSIKYPAPPSPSVSDNIGVQRIKVVKVPVKKVSNLRSGSKLGNANLIASNPIQSRVPMKIKPLESATPSGSNAVALQSLNRQELQSHVDDMQNSIDYLHDLFSSGNYNVDTSMLLSLFGESENYIPELENMASVSSTDLSAGNEVSVYNPSLLDFPDIFDQDDQINPTAEVSAMPSVSRKNKRLKLSVTPEKTTENDDELSTPQRTPVTAPLARAGNKRGK